MSLDLTTLALAKKYTDSKLVNSGGVSQEPLIVELFEDGTTSKGLADIKNAFLQGREIFASYLNFIVLSLIAMEDEGAIFYVPMGVDQAIFYVTENGYTMTIETLARQSEIPTDSYINNLINTAFNDFENNTEWIELTNYTTEEDLTSIEYTDLNCKEFVLYVNGRVNNAEDSLTNANASTYTYVNNVSHGGAATAFYVRPSGSSFPVIYHVEVLGEIIEQSVSRKSSGANMGNLQVSERIVEAKEINNIRVVFSNAEHLLKAGATIKVFVR